MDKATCENSSKSLSTSNEELSPPAIASETIRPTKSRRSNPFNFVSIVIPPSFTDFKNLTERNVEAYWEKSSVSPASNSQSILEVLVDKFLDPTFISPIADIQLYTFFKTKWTGKKDVPIYEQFAYKKYDGIRIKSACAQIQLVVGQSKGTPPLQQYCEIVKILGALPKVEERLITTALEKRMGPITALAQNVSVENINWFMSRLKMSISMPLIYEFFGSPTILGKINAIWKLLEAFEMLWTRVAWTTVQTAVRQIYMCFSWFMEQCGGVWEFLGEKFSWVKADRVADPQEIVKQADQDIVDSFTEDSTIMKKNDCLYYAIAPQMSMSTPQFKDQFLRYLNDFFSESSYKDLLEKNGCTATELSYGEMVRIADSEDMLHDIHVLVMAHFLGRNIIIRQHTSELCLDVPSQRESKQVPIYIHHGNLHFSPDLPHLANVISPFGTAEDVHIPTTCACNSVAVSRCSFCEKYVCQQHYTTCCTEVKANVKDVPEVLPLPKPEEEKLETKPIARVEPIVPVPSTTVQVENVPFVNTTPPTLFDRVRDGWYSVEDFFRGLDISEMGRKVADFLKNLFGNVYTWLKTNPVMVSLMGVVASLAGLLGFTMPSLTNPHDKRSLVSKLGESTRNLYYVQRTSGNLLDTFKGFGDALAEVLGFETDETISNFKNRVVEIAEQAEHLLQDAEINPGQFVNNRIEMRKYETKLKEVDAIYRDLVKCSDKANLQVLTPIWQKLNRTTTSLKQVYNRWMTSVAERQEPTVLWVYGPTNIGKSRLLDYVICELKKKYSADWEVFTLSTGNDHWNGFVGQEIVKIDDFGVWVAADGNLDARALMNLKTTAAFNPPMAALEEKNIMATPKFIIIASNHPTIGVGDCVTDIKAFERRRDVFVEVTWEGHAGVCNEGSACEHINTVRDNAIKNKQETFDHLTLLLQDANVTSPTGVVKRSRDQITVERLVEIMVEKEGKYKAQFEICAARHKIVTQVEGEQKVFTEYPTYALMGPPGTGKSFVMRTVASKAKSVYVTNEEEFTKFVTDKKAPDGTAMVVIDDMSNHLNSPHLQTFISMVKARSEQIDENTIPWIMGINRQTFIKHVHKNFNCAEDNVSAQVEAESTFFRRIVVIETSFKRKRIMKYTPQEVKEGLTKGESIDKMVQYRQADRTMTQQSVIAMLSTVKTTIETVQIVTELPIVQPTTPDMFIRFNITSDEFSNIIDTMSLPKIMAMLSSEQVALNSGILGKGELFARISSSVYAARSQLGLSYADFEDFFLQASLNGYLQTFVGHRAYIIFTDKTFSIETIEGKAVGHIVDDLGPAVLQAKLDLLGAVETVRTADFLAFTTTNFSPWFCFVGDLIMNLSKVGFSFLSVAKSVGDQKKFYKSYNLIDNLQRSLNTHIDLEVEDIQRRFDAQILNNSERDKLAYSYNTPDRSIFDSVREDTPGNYGRKNNTPKKPLKFSVTREDTPGNYTRKSNNAARKPINVVRKETDPERKRSDVSKKYNTEALGIETQACATQSGISSEYADLSTRGSTAKKITVQAVLPVTQFQELGVSPVYQAVVDSAVMPIAEALISNCLRIIGLDGKFICYGLAIHGNIGTTVWHILLSNRTYMAEDVEGNRYDLRFFNEIMDDDRVDFEMIPTHKGVAQFRSIVKHLVSASYNQYTGRQGILMCVTRSPCGKIPILVMRIYTIKEQTLVYCNDAGKRINLIKYMGYKTGTIIPDVMTRGGDCGSILLVCDSGAPEGRVIGMHSRASVIEAFVRPMFREQYLTLQTESVKPTLYYGKYMGEVTPSEPIGQKRAECVVRTYTPDTTKLFRNLVPIGPKLFEPAILSAKDKRNPGINMLGREAEKWLQEPPVIGEEDRNIYRQVVHAFAEHYANIILRNDKIIRVMTKQEAINKYRYAEHSEPIPVQTSPGFPWMQYSHKPGKMDYISVDEKTGARRFCQNANVRRLMDAIDRLTRYCKEEANAEHPIFQIALKDEPVKLKKIYNDPHTRTIACSPLHFTILQRQLTHAVVSCLNDCQNQISCAVGIDPNSNDWDMMIRRAMETGRCASAADYKGWDFTVNPFEIEMLGYFYAEILELTCTNFEPWMATAVINLYKILAHANIAVKDEIFEILRGIMSGHGNTANDNSFINEIRKGFDWVKIMRETGNVEIAGLDHYMKHIYAKYYGDDHFIVMSEFLKDVFNAHTIKRVEEQVFGVELTSPDKETELLAYVDLLDVSFMSRITVLNHHKFLGKLEWHRVCKPTWWVHDTRKHRFWESPDEPVKNTLAAFQAYEAALIAAVPWGERKFQEIRKPAQKVLNEIGYHKELPDYDTLYCELFDTPPSEKNILGVEVSHINLDEFFEHIGQKNFKVPSTAKDFGNRKSWHYGPEYTYTGQKHESQQFPVNIQKMLDAVNEAYDKKWNSCLFNFYPKGGRIPYHKDNEPELDIEEGVGCLTIYGGGTVCFLAWGEEETERILNPGDFYIMSPDNLVKYRHCRRDHFVPTLSVTFRRLVRGG